MELKNEFRVSVPIDVAWAVLTDLERVAPNSKRWTVTTIGAW
jgi:carbon monoxide dehydrogenase subunit G